MSSPNVGAVILAGGKSARMGVDKAMLPWRDGVTFLERTIRCLRHLGETLISVGTQEQFRFAGTVDFLHDLLVVVDRCSGRGPMGGVYEALMTCRSDWLLAVSCDMPLFERELADYLISKISGEHDIILAKTRDGRVHPLCGLYSRRAATVLAALMDSGNYRMMDAARNMGFLPVSLAGTPFSDDTLANVNTPAEYARLFSLSGKRPPVVAVCGAKKSGKTTILEGLIPALVRKGLRVAVIKHDGHDFTPDTPGTDSFRLKAAGAVETAVYSANRWMIVKDAQDVTPEQLAEHFKDADIILLEGGKSSFYPKIEVVRNGASPVCAPASLLALCAEDAPLRFSAGVPVFSSSDCEGLAAFIIKFALGARSLERGAPLF